MEAAVTPPHDQTWTAPQRPTAGVVSMYKPETFSKILRRDILFLALFVTVGVLIRLDFLFAGNFIIDADEAIVGLMAKHVLDGRDIPTFYYGQHYMGSLEPLLVSASFALFGISNFTMQLVPLIFSAALIPIVYLIGHEIAGRFTARLGALFCAVPPATLVIWSAKARGGFIEVVVIGAIAMLLTLRWLKEDRPNRSLTAWIGLLLGLGWWVNNQILYSMLPIGLMILVRLIRDHERSFFGDVCKHGFLGLAGFFVGGAPFWIYQFTNDFISFGLFGGASLEDAAEHAVGLITTALPILLGAKQSWQIRDTFPGASWIYGFCYAALFCSVIWWRRRQLLQMLAGRTDRNRPAELLIFFVLSSCCVFALSTFGWLVQAPRYLLPLYVAIFPLTALGIDRLRMITPLGAAIVSVFVLALNVFSTYGNGRALPGEPVIFDGERVAKDHTELIDWLYEQKIAWVRTNYWVGYRLAFETRERIRFKLVHDPRTDRIPAFKEAAKGINCLSMPLVLVPSQANLTRKALRKLGFTFSEVTKSGYVVFYDIGAVYPPTRAVPAGSISISANRNSSMAAMAIDGSLDTRWGTGEPQRPGEEVVVTFNPPVPIVGFEYSEGRWTSDYPRSLSIVAEQSDGSQKSLLSPEEFVAIRYYLEEDGEFKFYFPATEISRLKITQLGRHPVFDWSIAEIGFLSPSPEQVR